MGQRPDYEVFTSRGGQDQQGSEKNFYTKLGAGWKVAKGGISIRLDALPVDGKVVLFPVREDKEKK